jgi:hypothetical protein
MVPPTRTRIVIARASESDRDRGPAECRSDDVLVTPTFPLRDVVSYRRHDDKGSLGVLPDRGVVVGGTERFLLL